MIRRTTTAKFTTVLIYVGTFMISLLSFFTTYQGLSIFLELPLALLGSLGLQTAMLGIAWNLMRQKENRFAYVAVFSVAALFSIFFSYVNFNSSLKGNTRAQVARENYATDSRPILRKYASEARAALNKGEYQSRRLADLLEMEQTNGWATVVDEGSNDLFIQSVIDGARRTVASWNDRQGSSYHQGSGQGIIVNYLTTWNDQVRRNLVTLKRYVQTVDSLSLLLSSNLPVKRQFDLVNYASVDFPLGEYNAITAGNITLAEPPFIANYVEAPINRQQAMMLVINDLHPMDRLTFFSLFFAIVIDMIVLVMALCSSQAVDSIDRVFRRVERDATRRIEKLPLDDPEEFARSLKGNIERLREASEYSRHLEEVMNEFTSARDRIKLARGAELMVDEAESMRSVRTARRTAALDDVNV